MGKYLIHGYMYGRQAKKPEYWDDPQGTNRFAYFVPQTDLIQDNGFIVKTPEKHWLDD
jgi:hypothetical protein